jgi:hypothetical protein
MSGLEVRFPNDVLSRIIDEATIYMCACPAQVCEQIRHLRNLVDYQANCMTKAGPDMLASHKAIADMASQAHAVMEACLDRILDLEGWDRSTYAMPTGLRELQLKEVQDD